MIRFNSRGRVLLVGAVSAASALALSVAATPADPATAGPGGSGATAPHARGFDAAAFADPPHDSRPSIYWYWTGTVTPDVVDAQLAEMRDKGIYEAVLFPYGGAGMKPAYFTEAWFDIVGHVLREAKRTGMRIWLFNDSNFPSGKAGGIIANGGTVGDKTYEPSPELRLKALQRSTRVVEGPTTIDPAESSGLSVADGRLVVDAAIREGAHPLTAGDAWTDYTVTGKVRLTASGAQLVVRSSPDGTKGYLVDIDVKGRASVWRVDGDSRTQLTQGIPAPGFHPRNEQTVTVKVAGDRIQPVVNKTVQPVATDATYPVGAPAVSAEYGGVGVQDAVEGLQRVSWDHLAVTDPDGKELWSRTFDNGEQIGGFGGPTVRITGAVAAAARPAGSTDAADLVELTPELEKGSWRVPAGRWQVDTYGKAILTDDSSGYHRGYLDLLDPKATDRLFDVAQGEYVRRFGWAMGSVVPGFWDDEPFISSAAPWPFKRLPWSSSLEKLVEESGSTPGVAYTAAFEQLGRTGEEYSGVYWRAVNNAFATNYYQRQAEWMGDRGLQLITNPLLDEESPQKRMESTGDLAKDNQYAQVPGTDMITEDYVAGHQTSLGRNAAASAHHSGADRALSEVFGNSGWDVAPEYIHATIGALATRGVNSFSLHAMWTDEQQVFFAPPFGPSNTYWDAMGDVDAWIGRVSEMARGESLARTALLQPQRAAEQTRVSDTAHQLDEDLSSTAFALERGQVDFDIVSDGSFSGDPHTRYQARPKAGSLHVGSASYRMVVVPTTPVLDLETVKTLQGFVRAGGRVLFVGPLPEHEARGRDKAMASAFTSLVAGASGHWTRRGAGRVALVPDADAVGALAREADVAAAELSPAAPAVRVLRTGRGSDVSFLVNNESDQQVSTRATLPVDGVPEIWDPRTGEAEVATTYDDGGRDATTVPLELDPYETIAVVFRKRTKANPHLVGDRVAESVARVRNTLRAALVLDEPGTIELTGRDHGKAFRGHVTVRDPLQPIPVDGPWTVQLERDGESPQATDLGSWTVTDPTFSGSAVYRTSVDLTGSDLGDRRLMLDLGEVSDVAQVTVNGVKLPRALWSPYVVDATEALRAGDNTIEVRVTNTLLNRRSKTPPPSGLLGPVTLRPSAVVDVSLR
ncbi:twin-arginine translocation signal domain-containing protein [Nocardioides endophyticus]|uniref:Twin-arginine translocation signal domain-containing protein n=1 Tax=Nocardioides endophyticus TaxID=1353775 RepID=A0ABP8ZFL1_9ACTN